VLAITGLLAMVVGLLLAGAGLFGWEFVLSDGRYDYGWVSSLGRSGARSLLGAVGAGLLVTGFVARTTGVAAQPLPPETALAASAESADRPEPVGRSPTLAPDGPADNPATGTQPTTFDANPRAGRSPTASGAATNFGTVGGSTPPQQVVTIWNPTTEPEGEAGTFVTVRYRFEHGEEPQPGETYVWAIELPGGTRELEYEGDSLRAEGELRRLVDVNLVDVPVEWRTWLTREAPPPARQVSNRLTIVPHKPVRSSSPQ
jgi:hypothetical protein